MRWSDAPCGHAGLLDALRVLYEGPLKTPCVRGHSATRSRELGFTRREHRMTQAAVYGPAARSRRERVAVPKDSQSMSAATVMWTRKPW